MKPTNILTYVLFVFALFIFSQCSADKSDAGKNIAVVAKATSSQRVGSAITSINDEKTDTGTGPVRTRPNQPPTPLENVWIEYEWSQPVKTSEIELFWWDWEGTLPLPQSYRITYWNGSNFVPVNNPQGLGLESAKYNKSVFDEVETTKLRIEADSVSRLLTILQEWKVTQSPNSKNLPPIVSNNGDRMVMLGGKTYLNASVTSVSPVKSAKWSKVSGPGNVTIEKEGDLNTSATFSELGEYVLSFSAQKDEYNISSNLVVNVVEPPKDDRLEVVYTKKYSINSPLWSDRAKVMITKWIPWCISQCENPNLELGPGGLDNFIEAAKAIKGLPHERHKGYVFSNAWVHQTVESMCIALMVDPQGDREIIAAQEKMKIALEKWIPIILSGQEPDGYLQTAYTLRDTSRWENRWEDRNRSAHEGYVSGYFLESAINHYTLTEGKDLRLYDAAKKLADCWADNIGPKEGQIVWWDEHQQMEQGLVRFGRFVNDMEGSGKGDRYIALAKFLMDSRAGGSEYSQSHVHVQEQYEAVGHAVRAMYLYSAMSDMAAETRDLDYQSAVMSLWDNIVNKKYYVTGGIGSGETSEGFGPNYSLRHNAYCESCSSCGLIFFQYKLNLAYADAKYADLYEETMYNALLGSLNMEGTKFYYPNPLTSVTERTAWHSCPCCVGNIPRTLMMIPTWTYVTSPNGLFVNLYIGSKINVERVCGTDIEMVQETDYPWDGKVSITVNPKEEKEFTLFVRVPDRKTSDIYNSDPEIKGLLSFSVNGQDIKPVIKNGYAEVKKVWKKGDIVKLELPMAVQKVVSDERVEANRGKVALRYGPLIYNFEEVDNAAAINEGRLGSAPLKAEWDPKFFNGMMVIKGQWEDGKPLLAIPNYARMNRNTVRDREIRTSRSNVWINK